MNNKINDLLISLSKTKFRGSFHLNNKMKNYVREKGYDIIENHAYDLITKRLKKYDISKDGKQTPMRQVHPVFIAMHATGCCCRGCLYRIHKIHKEKVLDEKDIDYIVSVIMMWIKKDMNS